MVSWNSKHEPPLIFFYFFYKDFNEEKHLNLLNLVLIDFNWSTIVSNQCCWLQPQIDVPTFPNTSAVDGGDFKEDTIISYLLFTLLVCSSWLFSIICCENKLYFGIICGRHSIYLILYCWVPVHFHELIIPCLFTFLSPRRPQSTVGSANKSQTELVLILLYHSILQTWTTVWQSWTRQRPGPYPQYYLWSNHRVAQLKINWRLICGLTL